MPAWSKPIAAATLSLLLCSAAGAQTRAGAPVDRNVGDTGPNAASQRQVNPGIGQFGVGSMLTDRFGNNPLQPTRHDPYADPRVSQRFLLQSPGFTALIDRPDYIGVGPQGSWVSNKQTYDGTEILTLTPANTVFVLSPELLQPKTLPTHYTRDHYDNPYVLRSRSIGDPDALIRSMQIDRRAYQPKPQRPAAHPYGENYRHPAIIERERKLTEERAAEVAKRKADQAEQAAQTKSEAPAKPTEPVVAD